MFPHRDNTLQGKPSEEKVEQLLERLAELRDALNETAWIIHRLNFKWWHDKEENKLDRNVPELLCLMHSEISEGMEGFRKNLPDDKLPHYPMLPVELADAAIREFDTVTASGQLMGNIIYEKCVFNAGRKDHTWEAREAANGKKF